MKFLKHNHGLNKEQTEFLLKKHENHLKDHCYHYLFYYKFLGNSDQSVANVIPVESETV